MSYFDNSMPLVIFFSLIKFSYSLLFHSSEIDHLKALIRSRSVDAPVREEEKGTDLLHIYVWLQKIQLFFFY